MTRLDWSFDLNQDENYDNSLSLTQNRESIELQIPLAVLLFTPLSVLWFLLLVHRQFLLFDAPNRIATFFETLYLMETTRRSYLYRNFWLLPCVYGALCTSYQLILIFQSQHLPFLRRPDVTVMVEWALKINYLSIYLSILFYVWLQAWQYSSLFSSCWSCWRRIYPLERLTCHCWVSLRTGNKNNTSENTTTTTVVVIIIIIIIVIIII